ncbi:MAG: hypothetical protein DDT28_00912 [Dehalococcoidia bacterium]|nr:hypothetical protein [Chloroflexota bacterium]
MLALKLKVIRPEKQDPGQPVAMTGHGHGHYIRVV